MKRKPNIALALPVSYISIDLLSNVVSMMLNMMFCKLDGHEKSFADHENDRVNCQSFSGSLDTNKDRLLLHIA